MITATFICLVYCFLAARVWNNGYDNAYVGISGLASLFGFIAFAILSINHYIPSVTH